LIDDDIISKLSVTDDISVRLGFKHKGTQIGVAVIVTTSQSVDGTIAWSWSMMVISSTTKSVSTMIIIDIAIALVV